MAYDTAAADGRRKSAGSVPAKTLNLALQGGGAHGAFAWGVIDRLLEDERIVLEGVSASGAGAMNAAVLAHGLTLGGREGARRALASFWRRLSHAGFATALQPSLLDRLAGADGAELSPAYLMFDVMTRLFSPYELNPLGQNPLASVLAQEVDFAALRERSAVKLFVSATNVRTGEPRVFTADELSPEAVLASACLPHLFQAVEIDGEAYWDGGFGGSPALFPLVLGCEARDVLVVRTQVRRRDEVPRAAREILSRMSEISFNAALEREMRAIGLISRLIEEGRAGAGALRRMLVHAVEADDVLGELSAASRLNSDWGFVTGLRDIGRDRAEAWLEGAFDQLGARATANVCGMEVWR